MANFNIFFIRGKVVKHDRAHHSSVDLRQVDVCEARFTTVI